MARQDSHDDWPVDVAVNARGLARRRRLDPDRVLGLLERASRECVELDLGTLGTHEIFALLDEACDRLPPVRAFELFEQTDFLPRHVFRHGIPEYLAHEETPLYTFDELADLLETFSVHLERDEASLLKTGLPATGFPQSRWLDLHLGRLYHVAVPPEVTSAWASSEMARLFAGLSSEAKTHLEDSRPLVLGVKVRVLRTLAKALRLRETDTLVARVLQDLSAGLHHDEAVFLLSQDRLYRSVQYSIAEDLAFQCHPYVHFIPRNLPGGLSDMLHVAGHCAIELAEDRLNWTKKRLLDIATRSSLPGWRSVLGRHYVDAFDKPWREELTEIFDALFIYQFVSKHPERGRGFEVQVARAIENDFRTTVTLPVTAPRSRLPELMDYLRPMIEFVTAHQAATGKLPPWEPPAAEPAPQVGDSVFRQDGQMWTIKYGGRQIGLQDTKGLRCIHALLAHPGHEFGVLELVALVENPAPLKGEVDLSDAPPEQLEEMGLTIRTGAGNSDPLLDDRAIEEFRERRAALVERLNATRDASARRDIEREIRIISSQLDSSFTPGGRRRGFIDDAKKTSQAVRKSIRRALARVQADHPELWQHLNGALRVRTSFSYNPEPRVSWRL